MTNQIVLTILNSTGKLSNWISVIENVFEKSLDKIPDGFLIENVDVMFQDLPSWVIPEIGMVGYTYSGSIIHISLDSGFRLKESDIIKTILHELHHAARWQRVGYGETLGEQIISEGMACLFEEEMTGDTPIYAKVKITKKDIESVKGELSKTEFNKRKWFFGTDNNTPRWFGYTYGYQLCKTYAKNNRLNASSMVGLVAESI